MRYFLGELKRRNVYRVAVMYALVAWLLTQVASIVLPAFDAPTWVLRATITVLALGFPVSLVLAWVFELTPQGLKRDSDVLERPTSASNRRVDFVIIALLLVAVGYLALTHDWNGGSPGTGNAAARAPSIAVLPFLNLGGDQATEYFSDGLADVLIHELAQAQGLRVVA